MQARVDVHQLPDLVGVHLAYVLARIEGVEHECQGHGRWVAAAELVFGQVLTLGRRCGPLVLLGDAVLLRVEGALDHHCIAFIVVADDG